MGQELDDILWSGTHVLLSFYHNVSETSNKTGFLQMVLRQNTFRPEFDPNSLELSLIIDRFRKIAVTDNPSKVTTFSEYLTNEHVSWRLRRRMNTPSDEGNDDKEEAQTFILPFLMNQRGRG